LKKIKRVKREKSTTTKGHYVTNAQLLPAVIEAKQLGRVTNRLAKMLLLIAERYSRKSWFSGYSYREDMVAHAVANLCQNALKFDHTRFNNPFAYYTTAIHNSFQQYKGEEKKHRDTRDALLVKAGANPSFTYLEEHEREEHEAALKPEDEKELPESEAVDPIDDDLGLIAGNLDKANKEGKRSRVTPKSTVRAEAHASGPVKVYKPGAFVQDEDGNLSFLDGELVNIKKVTKHELVITPKKKPRVGDSKPSKKRALKK
jgi:hypothetical protein